jgi:hypothetical protein
LVTALRGRFKFLQMMRQMIARFVAALLPALRGGRLHATNGERAVVGL